MIVDVKQSEIRQRRMTEGPDGGNYDQYWHKNTVHTLSVQCNIYFSYVRAIGPSLLHVDIRICFFYENGHMKMKFIAA